MNINLFFIVIISGLFTIFFLFKPLEQTKQKFDEIPMLELKDFKLSELNTKGLTSVTNGIIGIRYSDRYTVTDLDYIDNSRKFISHIQSNDGLYKGNDLFLNGDVEYEREDGISFKTQKAKYNEKTKIMQSLTKYVSYVGENRATGSYLEYNNETGISKSKNVTINYKLKESN